MGEGVKHTLELRQNFKFTKAEVSIFTNTAETMRSVSLVYIKLSKTVLLKL